MGQSIRHKDISRNIRYFLWMSIHDAYMIGTNWRRAGFAPEIQERSKCIHCDDVDETMEHILTECTASGQDEVWKLARELWEMKTDAPWPEISLGTILASSNATFRTPEGHIQQGAMRFQRIMMSESAHLIWKMRCERVIQNENEPTTKAEVNKRWIKAINLRLEMDCRMTDSKYEKKALAKGLVLDTWTGTLLNEDNLPQDWTRETGVLVGIRPQENDGRGRDR
ncbi:hypothetical protein BDZ97DRAFT_1665418 [Flammula alnicola]|nr:hypothetical protein BDZ97DRAFT_1665418 [Flammula alnicola]